MASRLKGHMVVTALTDSPRLALLDDVTELAPLGDVGWGCYYDDNLHILKLERQRRDCHSSRDHLCDGYV